MERKHIRSALCERKIVGMLKTLGRSLVAAAAGVFLCSAGAVAQAVPSPSPVPSATPSAPAITVGGAFTGYSVHTSGVNATGALFNASGTDTASRTDLSNAFVTIAKTSGTFRFNVLAGAYAFPVVGVALNPTFQKNANTDLFGIVPNAYVQYVPNASLTFSAGILPTLFGQENAFTIQNVDIQRGLAWNAEPVVSRGIRAAWTRGKFAANLELDDGFYSGSHRAVEGLFGWQPDVSSNYQLAYIVPSASTPPNRTAAVANRAEYELMISKRYGKLQLLPYVLWTDSPRNPGAGFTRNETAIAAVVLANYTFNTHWSVAARFESLGNNSSASDTSANADAIGYGPGSTAGTLTVTPQYRWGHLIARAEYSNVQAGDFTTGLAFGTSGTDSRQTRYGIEIGLTY